MPPTGSHQAPGEGRGISEATGRTAIVTRAQLGEALTALRHQAGLTVRELAVRSGLRLATVGGDFAGKHLPNVAQSDEFRARC